MIDFQQDRRGGQYCEGVGCGAWRMPIDFERKIEDSGIEKGDQRTTMDDNVY